MIAENTTESVTSTAYTVPDTGKDPLTGLYSPQLFLNIAQELIDSEKDKSFDCLTAELHDFRLINAIYGIDAGDDMLRFVAQAISKTVPSAIGTRLSDKFFFISDSALHPSVQTCQQLVDEFVRYPLECDTIVQFGEYRNIDKSLSVSEICDRASLAVNSIKGTHTLRYAIYTEELNRSKIREHTVEAKFDRALSSGHILFYLQPQVKCTDGSIIGAEALARWIDDDGTMIYPSEFIPLFERDGNIVRLDEHIFRMVCEYIRGRMDAGEKIIPVSVNVSRISIHQSNTPRKYKAIADKLGVPAQFVPIEITESIASVGQPIRNSLAEFVKLGFSVRLDDFGSGYSSLSNLCTMPLSFVKIDKSLIDKIGQCKGNIVIKHVIDMSHELEASVIAEGVENAEQADFLCSIGCEAIQGYFYSPPLPVKRFDELYG